MKKILYLECNSGISGDMTVGALLDLGADREILQHTLNSLEIDGYHLHFGRTKKCGLDAYDFNVHLEGGEEHHHHHHEHHTNPTASGEHSVHVHRNLQDIYQIIDRMDSTVRVKELSKRIFLVVAEAESKAHGVSISEVHFHEVGAIDSIIDIISTAVCVENLGVDEIVVSALTEGFGSVRCQHGVIPVPVPATVNIASAYGLKLKLTDNEGEMVTPTGAAIAAALKTKEKLPLGCRILKIGMGAGKKDFNQANVLRAMLLEEEQENEHEHEDTMWVLEANIDDSTGEALGLAMEFLLEAGAADVWYTPVYMKKNRPAYMLSIICKKDKIHELEDILFFHTTTIGIRRYPVQRTVLSRRKKTVMTEYGEAEVKICTHKDREYYYPEFESVKKICKQQGLDYQSVYMKIREDARN